jgi:hypothetical protein
MCILCTVMGIYVYVGDSKNKTVKNIQNDNVSAEK